MALLSLLLSLRVEAPLGGGGVPLKRGSLKRGSLLILLENSDNHYYTLKSYYRSGEEAKGMKRSMKLLEQHGHSSVKRTWHQVHFVSTASVSAGPVGEIFHICR